MKTPDTADLHCPKSEAVADGLMDTHPNFNLNGLGLPIIINLKIDDKAHKHMPDELGEIANMRSTPTA